MKNLVLCKEGEKHSRLSKGSSSRKEGDHTDAKSQFLSKNSILIQSTPILNLNFPAKNGIIENLIFEQKLGFCHSVLGGCCWEEDKYNLFSGKNIS